jgi:hypothetical protein
VGCEKTLGALIGAPWPMSGNLDDRDFDVDLVTSSGSVVASSDSNGELHWDYASTPYCTFGTTMYLRVKKTAYYDLTTAQYGLHVDMY